MRYPITVWGLCGLVAAAACSDDGLTVQNQNSSTSSADSGGIESAATGEDQATATAGGSGGTTSPADTSATETSPPHDTDTGGPPSDTTGPELDTEGSSTTGDTDSTDGTDTTTGEPCMPITEDPSAIGQACMIATDCPAEYTCQSFQGIVLQQSCQILCTMDCECPTGLVCVPVMDKAASWMQCQ